MRELSILLVILIIFFVYMNFVRKSLHLELVKSNINNKKYYVRRLDDKQEAADKMANISIKLNKLIKHIEGEDKDGVKYLCDNFKSEIITENIPGSVYVAYSVNKGEELSLCIRDKDTNQFIDDNTIIFVAVHELAHIMTDETGHTPKFWKNMKYLLEKSNEINIYDIVDYSKNPIVYCGQDITSTPINLK